MNGIYLDIRQHSLQILTGETKLDVALSREASGKLTTACKDNISRVLKGLVRTKSWQARPRAICALDARGVTLRRLVLPVGANGQLSQMLLLQLESELPVSPSELAWGYMQIVEQNTAVGGGQTFLVAAVRRDLVDDYTALLTACGLKPEFTLACLARSALVPAPTSSYAILDSRGSDIELMWSEDGIPTGARTFPRSKDSASVADDVAKALGPRWAGRFYVAGDDAGVDAVTTELRIKLGTELQSENLVRSPNGPSSAAILGLKRSIEAQGQTLPLRLETSGRKDAGFADSESWRKWAFAAGFLAVALVLRPYAEAFALKPILKHRLASLETDAARLPAIDRELSFLQNLKQTQPPYLDSLFIFAKAAPPGARIDSVTMNRRGEVSIRGSARDGNQVADLRSKLIATGFFSEVTLEEQTPTPDRQKVNIRLTATWKPLADRAGLSVGPTAEEIEKAKTNHEAQVNGPPGMGMPGMGMPMMDLPPGVRIKGAAGK